MSSNMQPRDIQRELEEHGGFVQSLARRLVRDEAEAADAAQATWLAALQGKAPETNARAWLAQVLRRTVRRGYAREAERKAREGQASGRNAATSPVDEIVERQEALRHVTDAVLALDEPYRSTVLLHFHGGLQAAEIAAEQGVPVATVRSRLQRALARLRTALDARYDDRQAWCLALISLGRIDPGVLSVASAGAAGTAPSGAWMMGWKAKGWLVTGVLACGGLWLGQQLGGQEAREGADVRPSEAGLASAGERERPSPQAAAAEPAAPGARRSVAASPPEPTSATPAPPFGRIEVSARRASPGLPQPTWVVLENPLAAPSERVQRARTDERGRCVFASVVPGPVELRGERGGAASLEVRAGEVHVVDLVLPAGKLVHGTVVNEQGAPVAGAEIWLYGPSSHARGIVVGQSDANGEFRLHDVDPSYRLGALAPGLAPSGEVPLASVDWPRLDAHGIVLTLASAAGSAQLRVEDDQGHPVASALVSLTLPAPGTAQGSRPAQPLHPGWRSGPDGTLSLASLPAGVVLLRTTAVGYAPLASSLRIEAGSHVTATLALSRAARATGCVTSSAGVPLAGILIRPVLPFESLIPAARTGADGRYTLEDLPTGSIVLTATDPARGWASEADTFAPSPSETITWNPVMGAGRSVLVTLTGASGNIADRALRIRLEGNEFPFAFGQSDWNGSFQFTDCPPGPLAVDLFDARGMAGFLAQTQSLGPDEHEAWFDVSAETACEGRLSLRIAEGGTAALRMAEGTDGLLVEAPGQDDRIVFGELCPGTYDLELRQDGFPKRFQRGIVLAAGQQLDLGTFERGPMGHLEILVDGEPARMSPAFQSFLIGRCPDDAAPSVDPLLALACPPVERVSSVGVQEDASRLPLAPGRYLVRANGNGDVASATQAVTIEAGATSRLAFRSAPGILVSVECRPLDVGTRPAQVRGALASGEGLVYVQDLDWNASEGTFGMYEQVAPGTYTFAFQAEGREPETAILSIAPGGSPGPGQTVVPGPGFQILRIVVPMP